MIGSMLVSLGVAFSLSMGYLSEDVPGSWWILVVTATIQGVIMGLMMPSRQAIISEIVTGEQVMNAVSLNTMGMNTFRILAPAVTGFLIEAFDFASVYYVSSAMYALAVVCMFLLPRTASKYSEGSSAFTDIVDGVRYIRQNKTMLLVLVSTFFIMICGIIMGLALAGFASSEWWLVSVVVVIFIGLGQSTHRTTGNSLAQNYTEPEYRGRIMSFMMMGLGFSSLGTFFAGIIAEVIGIQWAIGGLAVILVVMSFALLTFTPRLRRLE